jgi:hypothetical protein
MFATQATSQNWKEEEEEKKLLLPYFEYRQIWQNILMDDCHLSNTTKLDFKRKFNFHILNISKFG